MDGAALGSSGGVGGVGGGGQMAKVSRSLRENLTPMQYLLCHHKLLNVSGLFQVVAMSRVTTNRLNVFQVVIELEAPAWRQPRLYPAQEFTDEEVSPPASPGQPR